jgi:hypothetical protein
MKANPEANFPTDYRGARKAFIAACEKARADTISRAHMGRNGPDGKPLFIDSAALGPRDAARAILVITNGAAASAAMRALLQDGVTMPDGARLVLVHALDPFAFMDVPGDPIWSRAMLKAIATEDLSRVEDVTVFACGVSELTEDELIAIFVPGRKIRLSLKQIDAQTGGTALRDAVKTEFTRL